MEENLFDKLNSWVNDTEGSLVNFLTAFAPWLAPLIPAYMTYNHMIEFLHFDVWLAWVLALVVEILGFGTVSTGLDFWFYNRRTGAKAKKAPLTLIVVSFGFYLALIVMSNVIIDWAIQFGTTVQQSWSIIIVRFLLTLQTLPAALIVATRTGHRDLLREIKQEKMEKGQTKVSESFGKVSESNQNSPKDWRNLRPTLSSEDVYNMAYLSPAQIKEIAKIHDVTERTVENWRGYARKEIGVD
jgi:hypothetical protein